MDDPQNHGKRSDRFYGDFIAKVVKAPKDDPEKLLRAQVLVFTLHETAKEADLPWAEFKLPVGCRINDGSFIPPQKDDLVWVDFPYQGDPRRPRITGSAHYAPGKIPNLPHETFAGANAYNHKRTGDEPAQPAHVYGEDTIFTQNGVMVAINKDGSLNIVQKSTGSEITITKDGDAIIHVEGNIYRSATKDSQGNISGDDKVLIVGHHETKAMGGIDLDGGSGSVKGVVQGDCLCCYSGKPHSMISSNVKASL